MLQIRLATEDDIPILCAFDHVAEQDIQRQYLISQCVQAGKIHLVAQDNDVVAYGALDYSFFGQGFIPLLYVKATHRRRGVGLTLLSHLEKLCSTPKLFTSTNQSNLPMQGLLTRRGYIVSGIIYHLDEDDPELIYFKYTHKREVPSLP